MAVEMSAPVDFPPAALITLFLTVVARPAAVAAILLPFRSHLRQVGVEDLQKLIYAGKMTDAKTVAAIMAYAAKYGK